jgi:hypothetical protein
MKPTLRQLQSARHFMRKFGHCAAKDCDCNWCIAAQALRTYELLIQMLTARKAWSRPGFGDVEWIERIENCMEMKP